MTVLGVLFLGIVLFWVGVYNIIVWPDSLAHAIYTKIKREK